MIMTMLMKKMIGIMMRQWYNDDNGNINNNNITCNNNNSNNHMISLRASLRVFSAPFCSSWRCFDQTDISCNNTMRNSRFMLIVES